jgi:MFS family permease
LRGKRIVFLIGVALFTFSALSTFFMASKELFYIVHLIQGVAAVMFVSTSVSMLQSFQSLHGLAIGINTATVYAEQTVRPYLRQFVQ